MKKILIAEDDTTVKNNLEIILSVNDFEVHSSSDGFECFNKLYKFYPILSSQT